ncbi:MAG: hypothetical protein LBB93_01170 [Elusimicrobiota bacterium]|jgi:hypothetical protein|nr:hypothetical protein [Elusimicrobiota bacterium]
MQFSFNLPANLLIGKGAVKQLGKRAVFGSKVSFVIVANSVKLDLLTENGIKNAVLGQIPPLKTSAAKTFLSTFAPPNSHILALEGISHTG